MRRILDVDPARNEVVLKEEDSDRAIRTYCFDTVVPESATQEEMFVRCGAANLVEKALQGYNCTIFACTLRGERVRVFHFWESLTLVIRRWQDLVRENSHDDW
jgi:hypothetical protein